MEPGHHIDYKQLRQINAAAARLAVIDYWKAVEEILAEPPRFSALIAVWCMTFCANKGLETWMIVQRYLNGSRIKPPWRWKKK